MAHQIFCIGTSAPPPTPPPLKKITPNKLNVKSDSKGISFSGLTMAQPPIKSYPTMDKSVKTLNEVKNPDGGTDTQTKSGELRWSFRTHRNEEDRQRYELFRRNLMDSEPDFQFAEVAREMSVLPENSLWDAQEALSPAAGSYLNTLDHLHKAKPFIAIKVAAIVAATSPMRSGLAENAASRVCDWLKTDGTPRQLRIELGLAVKDAWPQPYGSLDGLHRALLELLSQESAQNPDYVLRTARFQHEKGRKTSKYVVSVYDGPAALLMLGRNLKQAAPDITKKIYQTYLVHCRWYPSNSKYQVSEHDLRAVADELFELENQVPSLDTMTTGSIYNDLAKSGYPEASWYPIALERLFAAASAVENIYSSTNFFRTVAMNAPPRSLLFANAVDRFSVCVNDYETLSINDSKAVQGFTKLLLEIPHIAQDDKYGRAKNFSLPPDPQHPIVEIAINAYWHLVDWLQGTPSASVLTVLVLAIIYGQDATAEIAAARMASIFQSMGELDVNEASGALTMLAGNIRNKMTTESGQLRMKLFKQVLPILEALSVEAAMHAKKGLIDPAWDR